MLTAMANTAGDLIERLLKRPEIKAITAEFARDQVVERAALGEQKAEIIAQQLDAVRQYASDETAAKAVIARAQQDLTDAREAYARVERGHRLIMWPLGQRLDHIENQLRESASPAIAEFRAELGTLSRITAETRNYVAVKGIDSRRRVLWSDTESRDRRLAAIKAAGVAVDALLIEAIDGEALTARIEAIRHGIPGVERRPAKYADVDLVA